MSLTFSISVNSLAADVTFLEKGSPAPYTGYLFSEEKTLKIRKELIELDTLKLLETSYNKSIDLYKKNEDLQNTKVNLLLQQNDKLAEALVKSRERSEWETRIWFGLGILVSGLAVYGAAQLGK
jgi:hypothetical protein